MLKKVIGIFLILVAVLVGVHTIAEPLYHVSSEAQPYSATWDILNAMMIVALGIGIVYGYLRKSRADNDGDGVTREYLAANTLFYGFLFVSILFFWNWFNIHSPEFTAVADETISLVWIIIDATLPLLTGAMGIHLARGGGD